jgi:hypothetical protein
VPAASDAWAQAMGRITPIFLLTSDFVAECARDQTGGDGSRVVSDRAHTGADHPQGQHADDAQGVPGSEGPPASSSAPFRSTCHTCGEVFTSLQEQREHFKLDWHRLNVKRSVAGLPPLPEQACERLLADDASSLSGSGTLCVLCWPACSGRGQAHQERLWHSHQCALCLAQLHPCNALQWTPAATDACGRHHVIIGTARANRLSCQVFDVLTMERLCRL